MEKKTKVCCICGKEYKGAGNNPWPISGRGNCCDDCNRRLVIPARMRLMNARLDDTKQTSFTLWYLIDLMGLAIKKLKSADLSVSFLEDWPEMRDAILFDHHDLFHDLASKYVFAKDDDLEADYDWKEPSDL